MAAENTSADKPRRFAAELLGLRLPNGWRVVERFERGPDATGGNFSEGYLVEADGRRAFLKALDFSQAFENTADITSALEAMTAAYNDERDLLMRCRERRMNRVVLAVDHGSVVVDKSSPYSAVPYIIFDLADGDVRKHINLAQQFDVRWALRTLHHVASGLQQLHRNQIAHQDMKPSNVMMYDGGKDAKVGDLGRASQQTKAGQNDDLQIPGDMRYAPPELLYGVGAREWERRLGSDAYQLGSMIAFLFTGLSMTALWIKELAPEQGPGQWHGTFADVLPFVRDAFDRAARQVELRIPKDVRAPLGATLRHLCDPDPAVRGHPRERVMKHRSRFSLERFVTDLDLLARRAESALIARAG